MYKVKRYDDLNCDEHITGLRTLSEIANEYGHTEDVLEVYDASGELVGVCVWPQGSKCYMYSYKGYLDYNPLYRRYTYHGDVEV